MHMCRIARVVEETSIHKTIFFDIEMKAEPGQFVMIWIPGVDEVPMSLSYIEGGTGITVEKVGEATQAIHGMREGDMLGVRGPYGKGFRMAGSKALFVAGGTGIAPLLPLIKRYRGEKHVVLGARTKEYLLFVEELKNISSLSITTDDGSIGFKGFATEMAEKIMEKEDFDIVYTCGPEIMMKKMLDLCMERGIEMQASLERYMKCGIGVCGHCCIGRGLRVCVDGPVFNHEVLEKLEEFGVYSRDASGRRIYLG